MEKSKGILERSIQNKSVVETITETITQAIISGELKPGDKLPTEVELCQNLGVGRNSVREAIKILEAYGVVYIKRAEGTFVVERYNQKMLDPLLYGMILQETCWEDFVELRSAIDIGTLHVVCRNCMDQQLKKIRFSLDNLVEAVSSPHRTIESVMEADNAFHMEITKAANNKLLMTSTEYIARMTIPSRMETIGKVLEKGNYQDFIALHQQIYDLIKEKQVIKIEEVILNHYVYWKENNLKP